MPIGRPSQREDCVHRPREQSQIQLNLNISATIELDRLFDSWGSPEGVSGEKGALKCLEGASMSRIPNYM